MNGYDTQIAISNLLGERNWRNRKSKTTVEFDNGFTVTVKNHSKVILQMNGRKKTYSVKEFNENSYQLLRKFEENTNRDF